MSDTSDIQFFKRENLPNTTSNYEVKIIGDGPNAYPFFKIDIDKWAEFDSQRAGAPADAATEAKSVKDAYARTKMSYWQVNEVIAIIDENGDLFLTALPTSLKDEQDREMRRTIMRMLEKEKYAERSFFVPLSENSMWVGEYPDGATSELAFTNAAIKREVDKLYSRNNQTPAEQSGKTSESTALLSPGESINSLAIALSKGESGDLDQIELQVEKALSLRQFEYKAMESLLETVTRLVESSLIQLQELNDPSVNPEEKSLSESDVRIIKFLLEKFRPNVLDKLRFNSPFSAKIDVLSPKISLTLSQAMGTYNYRKYKFRDNQVEKGVEKFLSVADTPEFENKYRISRKKYVADMSQEERIAELKDWEELIDGDDDILFNYLYRIGHSGYLSFPGRLEDLMYYMCNYNKNERDTKKIRYNADVLRVLKKLLTKTHKSYYTNGHTFTIWERLIYDGHGAKNHLFRMFSLLLYMFRNLTETIGNGTIFADRYEEIMELMEMFTQGDSDKNKIIPSDVIYRRGISFKGTVLEPLKIVDDSSSEDYVSFSEETWDKRVDSINKLKQAVDFMKTRKTA